MEVSGNHLTPGQDRRTRKTREALHDAFVSLVLQRRYEEIRVKDIVEDADVGRATFYEHYAGKDDLLVQCMSAMLDVLADAALPEGDRSCLEMVLRHFWENRRLARAFFSGSPSRHVLSRLTRELASRIERRLEEPLRVRGVTTIIPLHLVATQSAEAQFALIHAWLASDGACSAADLAGGLQQSCSGAIAAIVSSLR